MDQQYNRDFKGIWIPKEIWLDERLTALDKIILAEIDSLDCSEKGCYASNEYIAQFCGAKANTVSLSIKKLIDLEYLEVIKFDGRQRFIKSRLLKNQRQTLKKSKADFEKIKDINIDDKYSLDNNTLTSIIAQSDQDHSVPPVITITLNDKSEYPIYQSDINKWQELYQSVDIIQELRKMKGWADANPTKRKTKNGIKKFINAWLSREQDSYHNSPSKRQPKYDVKDMEADDSVDLVKLGKELFGDD